MSDKWITAYIALGSNIGDRTVQLDRAIEMLGKTEGMKVITASDYYNTAPVGYEQQPDFLNAVVEVETILTPKELLNICADIEKELKRERIIRWGPRTIDLDILLYGDMILNEEALTIPHPRMHERTFVLEPLSEIASGVVHPVLLKTIGELYETLNNK